MAHPHLSLSWRVEGFPRAELADAHGDGADSRRILRRWLGLKAREIARLEQTGAVLPPVPMDVRDQRPPGPVYLDFAEKLGLPAAPSPEPLPYEGRGSDFPYCVRPTRRVSSNASPARGGEVTALTLGVLHDTETTVSSA